MEEERIIPRLGSNESNLNLKCRRVEIIALHDLGHVADCAYDALQLRVSHELTRQIAFAAAKGSDSIEPLISPELAVSGHQVAENENRETRTGCN